MHGIPFHILCIWTLKNADFADKKEEKSAFLCVNQRPKLISDNV